MFYKFVNRPRADDSSPLAKFYYANQSLKGVVDKLNALGDFTQSPECEKLIDELKLAQKSVINVVSQIMDICLPKPSDRANRDYRLKFAMDYSEEYFPPQIWFCAECLAAGSKINGRPVESLAMRPMAIDFIRILRQLLDVLQSQALLNPITVNTNEIRSFLKTFDNIFADFELNMVSLLKKVKSPAEYERQQNIAVLFSESLIRGLHHFADNPPLLNIDGSDELVTELFRKSRHELILIRYLMQNLLPAQAKRLEDYLINGHCDLGEEKKDDLFDVIAYYQDTNWKTSSGEVLKSVASLVLDISIQTDILHPPCRKWTDERLIHQLFISICSVADQLQSEFPGEFNHFMKIALQLPPKTSTPDTHFLEQRRLQTHNAFRRRRNHDGSWMSKFRFLRCSGCQAYFCLCRRRYRCRNCKQIFCSKCSFKQMPLLILGPPKLVRICGSCFARRQQNHQAEQDMYHDGFGDCLDNDDHQQLITADTPVYYTPNIY